MRLDPAIYLPQQSELDRATEYPYAAPEGAFTFHKGTIIPFDSAGADALLTGRTAVLSVGSNRAPVQLRRKFGDAATVPVTPAILHDCDIVHAAMLGYYGAVPATAFPSTGCDVTLNVAWLDAEQLVTMHRTEAIGVAYEYVKLAPAAVTHLPVNGAAIVSPATEIFGYSARSGVLDFGEGAPAGLAAIPASNRKFLTQSQAQAAQYVRQLTGHDDARSMAAFITDITQDRTARDATIDILQAHKIMEVDPPWEIVPVTLDGIEDYL